MGALFSSEVLSVWARGRRFGVPGSSVHGFEGADELTARVMVARIELLAARFVARTPVDELADGGGTDMRVGINAALSTPGRPQLVIVLTDGHTPWPDENPACRMIAGLVGDRPPQPPAWVEAVRIR